MEWFTEHTMEDPSEEVYQMGIISWSVPLLRTIGGASVGLLRGITSTKTDPVLLSMLPKGLGIYRTLF